MASAPFLSMLNTSHHNQTPALVSTATKAFLEEIFFRGKIMLNPREEKKILGDQEPHTK